MVGVKGDGAKLLRVKIREIREIIRVGVRREGRIFSVGDWMRMRLFSSVCLSVCLCVCVSISRDVCSLLLSIVSKN